MSVFKDFNRVGVTTLIASHDEALMDEYSSRTFRITPGRFVDLGDKHQAPIGHVSASHAGSATTAQGSSRKPA